MSSLQEPVQHSDSITKELDVQNFCTMYNEDAASMKAQWVAH